MTGTRHFDGGKFTGLKATMRTVWILVIVVFCSLRAAIVTRRHQRPSPVLPLPFRSQKRCPHPPLRW